MAKYRLQRIGDTDLEFDGELLACQDTKVKTVDPNDRFPPDLSRWMEVHVYGLSSGRGWVTAVIGKSERAGEHDRPRAWVCHTPVEVRDSLRRQPQGYLTKTALDALTEAADKDPRLKTVLVERI